MPSDRKQSAQLSTACSTDTESSESRDLDATNEISPNIEECRHLQRVDSQTSSVGQLTENSPPVVNTLPNSNGPVPLTIDQITQRESTIETSYQQRTTDVNQESRDENISVLIQDNGVVTSTVESKIVQRSKTKRQSMQFPMEPPPPSTQPSPWNELNLSIGSTEFYHRQQWIPIHAKELCDVQKISHGEFGQVFSVVTKKVAAIPIAVKRIPREEVKVSEVKIMLEVCGGEDLYIIDYYCALFDNDNKYLFICMEFMDTSIDAFYKTMHKQDKLECNKLEQLLHRITHDIASGLNFMARKEIIHRDIKPANLLINKDAYVKLCDFGISRSFAQMDLYSNNLNDIQYYQLSPLLFTENYMPQRITGTIRDDMWSLGITLLEVVSGQNPIAAWKSSERSGKPMTWEPSIPDIISNDLQRVILHLLKKEPGQRPAYYDDILNDLATCGLPVLPSNDETAFVRYIIEKISRTDNSD